jgi:hypothetical protein
MEKLGWAELAVDREEYSQGAFRCCIAFIGAEDDAERPRFRIKVVILLATVRGGGKEGRRREREWEEEVGEKGLKEQGK